MAAIENGNDEIFTPNLIQIRKHTNKGSTHNMVNAVETNVGGLFSGSLNTCLISDFGRFDDLDFRETD